MINNYEKKVKRKERGYNNRKKRKIKREEQCRRKR